MKKTLFFCFAMLLCIVLILPLAAEAAVVPMEITVQDKADLLTLEEEQAIADLQGRSPRDVRLFLVTATRQLTEREVAALCGADQGEHAAVLVIDRNASGVYYYEMFLFNRADKMMTISESNAILDDPQVYGDLKNGRLAEGATRFFSLVSDEIDEWYRQRPLWITGVGIGVGLLIGGITVLCVFLGYRKKRHGESYPLSRYANLQLTESVDHFVGSFVTRVRIQSNSGSSGGGGGGGFSGGSRGRR